MLSFERISLIGTSNVLVVLLFAVVATTSAAVATSPRGGGGGFLRGLQSAHWDIGTHGGFDENLGKCTGAVCGMWGDPHIVTCDGLAYDCQGEGIFTLMRNHWYNIQAHFVSVGATEMIEVLKWGNYPKATSTNDVMIQVEDDELPILQFTFPDMSGHDGLIPSEEGCFAGLHYEPFDMPGHPRSEEANLQACKDRCDATEGCAYFSYWMDHGCHVQDANAVLVATPEHWTRSVSGPVNTCGRELARTETRTEFPFAHVFDSKSKKSCWEKLATAPGKGTHSCGGRITYMQNHHKKTQQEACEFVRDEFPETCDCSCDDIHEEHLHENFGNGCPALLYVDGELMDVSDVEEEGYLYGNETSHSSAKLVGENKIRVQHKTPTGSFSEAMLEVVGNGPGELFGCHWNFWVCLPEDQEEFYRTETVGLLGSPDGNTRNDWMDVTGEPIPIPQHGERSKAAFDYCRQNWCVSQADSIMTYPESTTYADHKCHHEEYVEFDVHYEGCVISADKILALCSDKIPAMLTACHIDCCYGGCDAIDHVEDEIIQLEIFSVEQDEEEIEVNIIYDIPDEHLPPPMCDEQTGEKSLTGDAVCPSSSSSSSSGSSIVELDRRSSDELPYDGAEQDMLYGIVLEEAKDFNIGRSIKFNIDNVFDADADVYVSYERKVGRYSNEPVCDSMPNTRHGGCDPEANTIEVGCVEGFPGTPPFAIVDLYFVSNGGEELADSSFIRQTARRDTAVHKCCHPPEEYNNDDEYGVVKYTLTIQCTCPNSSSEENDALLED